MLTENNYSLNAVAIVGAGVIGRGVALDCALAGLTVHLVDNNESVLAETGRKLTADLRLCAFHGRKIPDGTLQRIHLTAGYEALGAVSYVVENITENLKAKSDVYRQLSGVCSSRAVIAANTSCVPIAKLAACYSHPENVLGIHFMNPVPIKRCVEVILAEKSSESAIRATEQFLDRLGKRYVKVNDSPGFVSNRVLMLTVNESINVLHEGVATAESIDRIFRECFSHSMGPLETADLIGLDTIKNSLDVLYDEFGEEKFRPSPKLQQMVAAGLLGRKTGKGFYLYE